MATTARSMAKVRVLDPLNQRLDRMLGRKTAEALAKSGLRTAGDLLRRLPNRYAERGELTELASLQLGEYVTVVADVERVSLRRMQRRRGTIVEAVVTDGTGRLSLAFFNQAWRRDQLRAGRRGLFAGKVTAHGRVRQLAHPECWLFDDDPEGSALARELAGGLIPVYPATELPAWKVLDSIRVVLTTIGAPPDPLPDDVRQRHGLVDLAEALSLAHRPQTRADVATAHRRFAFEEAFGLQVVLARRRAATAALPAVPRLPRPDGLLARLDDLLPFTLTEGQRAASAELLADLARDHPMHRLLQGEVGAGKTLVALRAMLTVVDAGGQAALLAPTEVLAQQHFRTVRALLGPLADGGLLGGGQGTTVALLTGSLSAAARRQVLAGTASGEVGILVGTHALLAERVGFADLGLVVVDEQHRFGVEQRAALTDKGDDASPHLLVMTATPIPRTIAMTVFGDLETTVLRELPAGRPPAQTTVVPVADRPGWLDRVWQRVREEVESGAQCYVVCPRIGGPARPGRDAPPADPAAEGLPAGPEAEELPTDGSAARPPVPVLELAPMLAEGPLAGLRVEALHGRLPAEDKDAVMRRFATGTVDVLVATTVVEVGVDVPNATMMVVMDAERFGVSQLHQLRGRVRRGTAPGLCLLVTDALAGSPARERLQAVAATADGFTLSEVDLRHRREGDVLGTEQSGRRSGLRLVSVLRDADLIERARVEATRIVERDPDLRAQPVLLAAVDALASTDEAAFLAKG